MPPQLCIRKKKKQHLYELLRPELVKSNPVPLRYARLDIFARSSYYYSSDALTNMSKYDPQQFINDTEVCVVMCLIKVTVQAQEACRRLFLECIPKFAFYLDQKFLIEMREEDSSTSSLLSVHTNSFTSSINVLHRPGNTFLIEDSTSEKGQKIRPHMFESLVLKLHQNGINIR